MLLNMCRNPSNVKTLALSDSTSVLRPVGRSNDGPTASMGAVDVDGIPYPSTGGGIGICGETPPVAGGSANLSSGMRWRLLLVMGEVRYTR